MPAPPFLRMFKMLVEYIVVGAAGGLFARAIFWHVPLMLARLGRYCHACGCWWGDHELFCPYYIPDANWPAGFSALPPLPAPKWDPEAYELQLFKETGVWWLDPNRWGDQPEKPRISSTSKPRWDANRYANAAMTQRYDQEQLRNAYAQHVKQLYDEEG